ncbi:porin [Shewanella sp. NIFS-20-20]|uniref:porin n=1 Tax=Shewanella sp. NIFS-20-20 TaxID=2853806 RepID=UPI001C47005D|nr:porin [Shewanella sp. NIFS-20-20]MBV7316999.1 porin [Shewanella sp. NIFS-20-20]
MKRHLIASSVIAALTALASTSALAAEPNFYGRLDLATTHSDTGFTTQNKKSGTVLENNFSYLGVKGSESIANGLDIVYQMEFQVENTGLEGNKTPFKARNTFLGLKTTHGTVLIGRSDPVFKQSEGNVDMFGNTNADIDRLIAGQGRVADGIWYYSPKFADLVTFDATYLMADNYNTSKAQYALGATLGDKGFKAQNYYVAAAYMDGIENIEAYRVVGQVKCNDFKFGGVFQHTESQTYANLEGNTYFVNAAYYLNGVNLKVQFGQDDSGLGGYIKNLVAAETSTSTDSKAFFEAITDVSLTNISVGADYRVAKSTLVYGQFAHYSGELSQSSLKTDLDDSVLSVGVRYDF